MQYFGILLFGLLCSSYGDVYISDRPRHQRVTAGEPVTFRCVVRTYSTFRGKPDITWVRNDGSIDFNSWSRFTLDPVDNSLTITNTVSTDSGFYECIATSGSERDSAIAKLTVEDIPDAPLDVTLLSNCENRVAEVQWSSPEDNNSPITQYIIEYNTTFSPHTWSTAKAEVSSERNYQRITLSPWGNYSFRVIAVNSIGRSQPSLPSRRVCSTPPDVPHHNPREVCARNLKPHALYITWKALGREEHNGPGFHYGVKWRVHTGGPEQIAEQSAETESSTPFNETVVSAGQSSLVVENQEVYTSYDIVVLAENEIGEAMLGPTVHIGYSGEDVPFEIPSNFRLDPDKEVTSTTADFLWDDIETSQWRMQGFFRGFKIQFWKTSAGKNTMKEHSIVYNEPDACWKHNVPLSRQKRESQTSTGYKGHVYNLWAYTNITAHIMVLNTKYQGPPSASISFVTREGVPGPVHYLSVVKVWPDKAQLQWHRPTQTNGVLVGYTLLYSVVGTQHGELSDEITIDSADATSRVVEGLRSNSVYQITVRGRTRVGQGSPYRIEFRTLPGGTPVVPGFRAVNVTDRSLNITWFSSTSGNLGTSAIVQYRKQGYSRWLSSEREHRKRWVEIDGLISGVIYEVRVNAYNGDLPDSPMTMSGIQRIHAGPLRELPVPRFKVEIMEGNTLGVSLTDSNPSIQSFYVQYRMQGNVQWTQTDSRFSRGWIIIRRLTDGAQYELRVLVRGNFGEVISSVEVITVGNDPDAQASFATDEVKNAAARLSVILPFIMVAFHSSHLLYLSLNQVHTYIIASVMTLSALLLIWIHHFFKTALNHSYHLTFLVCGYLKLITRNFLSCSFYKFVYFTRTLHHCTPRETLGDYKKCNTTVIAKK